MVLRNISVFFLHHFLFKTRRASKILRKNKTFSFYPRVKKQPRWGLKHRCRRVSWPFFQSSLAKQKSVSPPLEKILTFELLDFVPKICGPFAWSPTIRWGPKKSFFRFLSLLLRLKFTFLKSSIFLSWQKLSTLNSKGSLFHNVYLYSVNRNPRYVHTVWST